MEDSITFNNPVQIANAYRQHFDPENPLECPSALSSFDFAQRRPFPLILRVYLCGFWCGGFVVFVVVGNAFFYECVSIHIYLLKRAAQSGVIFAPTVDGNLISIALRSHLRTRAHNTHSQTTHAHAYIDRHTDNWSNILPYCLVRTGIGGVVAPSPRCDRAASQM